MLKLASSKENNLCIGEKQISGEDDYKLVLAYEIFLLYFLLL